MPAFRHAARRTAAVVNAVLRPAGVRLVREAGRLDPATSAMESPELRRRLADGLGATARLHLSALGLARWTAAEANGHAAAALDLYAGRPFGDNEGGGGFHNAFWLVVLARALRPLLVVESGVWQGHTTWLLAEACPGARVVGFDLDLGRLDPAARGHPRVEFVESDWAAHDFGAVDAGRSLAVFDCHVSHARRIAEASARGFRHLALDDDAPLERLYAYGHPPVPTARMLADGDTPAHVAWRWRGRRVEAAVDPAEAARAQALVRHHAPFPDVGGPTRYGGFSDLGYVAVGPRP